MGLLSKMVKIVGTALNQETLCRKIQSQKRLAQPRLLRLLCTIA
jgi:hypothetical protein